MKLSRYAVGQALKTAREAARLSLADLAASTSLTVSSLSRSERGERDLAYAEMIEVCGVLKITDGHFRHLVETFETGGASQKKEQISSLASDLNDLQRAALELAIEARNVGLPA